MILVDITDSVTRSRMMATVRSSDTRPELVLRQALRDAGLRGYRVHRRDIPGRPDIAWVGRRIAIFVDGAFWHGHPSAFTPGKSGEFWDKKITSNIERDRRVNIILKEKGWDVIRFWDFEILEDPGACALKVKVALHPSDDLS